MKNAIINWNLIKQKLLNRQVVLFLDFDGTLAPIASIPSKARLPLKTRRLLQRIIKQGDIEIVINSGREIKDLRSKVGIRNIYYIGNHGAQFQGPGMLPKQIDPRQYRQRIEFIKKKMKDILIDFPGAFLEDKKIILTVHYRLLNPLKLDDLLTQIEKIIRPYEKVNQVFRTTGKKVVEIKPPKDFNKGLAVTDLLIILSKKHHKKVFPISVGDDITDEDTFKVLRKSGIGIHVGSSQTTHAKYTLKNTNEVYQWLKLLEGIKGND